MEYYFLTECPSCLEVIPMKAVNCPCCGSFQMYYDKELYEKKAQSFQLLAQHRSATEERIEKLFKMGLDESTLVLEKIQMDSRRKALAQMVMEKIEEKEYFLLN